MRVLKQTIISGIFYLLIVTTFMSFSYIITYIYENKKDGFQEMGPLLLAANYGAFMLTNSFVPSIKLSLTNEMKVAALCYTFNYLIEALELPGIWGLVCSVLGAMVGGFGASLLWICYGGYMKALCKSSNEEHMLGKYFGILNGITFSSSMIGGFITTFALGYFSDSTYFFILAALGLFSFFYCHFLIKDVEKVSKPAFQCKQEFVKNCRFYTQMRSLVATLVLDGFMLGFISTTSSKLLPQEPDRVTVGVFFIFSGAGSMIGGFLSGFASDLTQMKNVGKLGILSILTVSLLTMISLKYSSNNFANTMSFLWGFCLQFLEGWIYVVCSRNYNGQLEAYANTKQLHALFFCIYEVIVILTHNKISIMYLMLLFFVIGGIAFCFLDQLPAPPQVETIMQPQNSFPDQFGLNTSDEQ